MEDILDIREPVYLPDPVPVLWIAAGVAACLLVGYLLWLKLRKKPGVVLTPYELAARELNRIRQGGGGMDDTAFTLAVSDAVRGYLERGFALPAPELTTEEFFETLGTAKRVAPDLLRKLQPFLEHCDLVKFARQSLDEATRKTLLETAADFVDKANRGAQEDSAPPTPQAGGAKAS